MQGRHNGFVVGCCRDWRLVEGDLVVGEEELPLKTDCGAQETRSDCWLRRCERGRVDKCAIGAPRLSRMTDLVGCQLVFWPE